MIIFGLHTLVLFSHLLGLLTALYAVSQPSDRASARLWLLLLLVIPSLAVPLYWAIGRSLKYGTHRRRPEERDSLTELQHSIEERLLNHRCKEGKAQSTLESMSGLPLVEGNSFELFLDGQSTFSAIYKAMNEAEKTIVCQFYLVRDDQAGQTLTRHLLKAAAKGVRVYLFFDPIEDCLSEEKLDQLREAGVKIAQHTPVFRSGKPSRVNYRNHRKITVIDGRRAFLGGFNVGEEYQDGVAELAPWRDTHFELRGPAVLAAQWAFTKDFHYHNSEVPDLPWDNFESEPGETRVSVISSGPGEHSGLAGLAFMELIGLARERVWLTTPFLCPDEAGVAALELACLRGVDVRILLPSDSEVAVGDLLAWHFIERLFPKGARFYRKPDGSMHQKVVLVDQDLAILGSANFDYRSFHLNHEVLVWTESRELAGRLEKMLKDDMEEFVEIQQSDLDQRSRLSKLKTSGARMLDLLLGG